MATDLKTEINLNYDFFQRNMAHFIRDKAGKYTLLRTASVVDFFDGPGEAYRAGLKQFPDGLFSIQKVSGEPVEMGLFSVAIA